MNYQDRLLKAIPGGAHTYSKGFDQYPSNAPAIMAKGKGAYLFDSDNRPYLDYGMAMRSVSIGYANERVNQAALTQMNNGNSLSRPSLIELQAAQTLIDLIDGIDMVKFTKNGSTAVTAAVKLSRAYTNRAIVVRCQDHPFFSYDDWFIASTPMTKGIPEPTHRWTKSFIYNDIDSLYQLFNRYPQEIACVILEPATTDHPTNDFLHEVKALCHQYGALFILDEMVTGFRWHLKGAAHYYNITPDLCTFGKAMGNGFSVCAIGGKEEIMQQGSIEFEGQERLFLLSTTHGAEMSSLGAFIEAVRIMQEKGVVEHLWQYGNRLINMMNTMAQSFGISHSFIAGGVPCSPYYTTLNQKQELCLGLKTLFMQEMINRGVLMPFIALSYAHQDRELALTKEALAHSFAIYAMALEKGYHHYLKGDTIKPVFRKYN